MNRRKFLTQAGITSIALASLPALATRALAAPERGQMGFHFMVISFSPPTSDLVPDTLVMAGAGDFTSQQVVGSGIFNLLKAAASVSERLRAFGTWKAKRLLNFELVGTYGAQVSGVLELEIHLVPAEGSVILAEGAVIPATLEVVCNVGFGGLSTTGEEEGIILTIPDAPFGPFKPSVPPAGLTTFTTGNEQRD